MEWGVCDGCPDKSHCQQAITATDGQGRSQASVRVLTTAYTGMIYQQTLQ